MSSLLCEARVARLVRVARYGGLSLLCLAATATAQPLRLSEVLSRAARADLTAPARAAAVDAAQAGVRQAGIGPQPTVGVDLEDFAGSGPYSPADRSQTTLYYERKLERGGKREARTAVARAEVELTRQQAAVRALDYLSEVQVAWVEAQAAGAAEAVAEERLQLAQRLEKETARRVGRALDPLFAGERSRAATAQARVERDRAADAARAARAQLASYLELGMVDLDPADFAVGMAAAPGDKAPDIALLEAGRDAAGQRVGLERAAATTDPTFRAGLRHFGQGSDVALVVGGSIPLGGQRASRGNIERAESERIAAEAEIAVASAKRQREIDRLVADRAAILRQIAGADETVMPRAEKAVALARDGFNRGGTAFTFLEVAEAQRAVVDARLRRVDLLKSYHLDGVRLDRLTGRHLPLIPFEETR
jgi:outer membrane protein, heavy metal efflux system